MSVNTHSLHAVDVAKLPKYPISVDDRLDSHFFIPWNIKRWRKSEFRQLADPDVGWSGFLLFCEAHDETPVGTLPTDERLLARAAGVSLDVWRQLCGREMTPLHKWAKVLCDNGEIRLAHPVATEVALEALKSRRRSKADAENRRRAKRLKDLKEMIAEKIGAPRVLAAPNFLERFNDWLDEKHPNVQRREVFIRSSIEEFQSEMSK